MTIFAVPRKDVIMRNSLLHIILLLITLLLAGSVQAQERDRLGELDVVCRNEISTTLQSGDLLFLNENQSAMEKAITASTGEYTHVALVERDSADGVWVIEASPKEGVQRISYEQFERNHNLGFFGGNIDIYRLAVPFDTAAVIARAKSFIGKPYDNAFLPDNDAYYCSELIQVAFGGIFPSQPMNWRDADGNLPEYWIKHFEKLGVPVPEGVPGTNPTDMSRSPLLKRLK